jgi:hypothetical protein
MRAIRTRHSVSRLSAVSLMPLPGRDMSRITVVGGATGSFSVAGVGGKMAGHSEYSAMTPHHDS